MSAADRGSPASRWPAARAALAILAILAAAGSLAGCGQRGPLYLPQSEKQAIPRESASSSAASSSSSSSAPARGR